MNTKKNVIIAAVVVVIVLAGAVFAMSHNNVSNQELENKVGATIFPLYDIARQIAGDEFEVVLLLPAGASPHTFDPQPSLLRDLQGARAVFAIGHGLDDWSNIVAESIDAPVITMDHGVELRATEEEHEGHEDEDEHGHEDEHEHEDEEAHEHEEEADHGHEEEHKDDHGHAHGPIDPHYWLSIHNAERVAMNIAEELAELDSENASLYMERAEAYAEELEVLEAELQRQAATLTNRNIISLHDAWYYFADEFGLNLVGTFEPSAAEEPTPQYLANLAEEIEEHNVSVLFMEPQLSTDSIKAFAGDHNLGVAVIDPLGGVEGRNSYIDLMRYNVEQVVSALAN